jgi:hypothetical protein
MSENNDVLWIRYRSKTDPSIWFVHPDLPARLAADAAGQGSSLSDVARRILSQHLGVPYEPNPKRYHAADEKDSLQVTVSPAMTRALASAYPKRRLDGVRLILCRHYGLTVPDRVIRRRARGAAAA